MSSSTILSAFNGHEVKHLLINPEKQHNLIFDKKATLYDPSLRCQNGTPNVDNVCCCEGSVNSSPYFIEPPHFDIIYAAEQPKLIQPPGNAARQLMKQRSPLFMLKQ